jgi:hypothetical protein
MTKPKKQKLRISYRATREEVDFLSALAEAECLPSRESVLKRLIRRAMAEAGWVDAEGKLVTAPSRLHEDNRV